MAIHWWSRRVPRVLYLVFGGGKVLVPESISEVLPGAFHLNVHHPPCRDLLYHVQWSHFPSLDAILDVAR